MTEKRFLKGYHTIRDKKENKIYDFRIENVLFLLNELDEKWIGEFSLRETLQVDLQRVEKENEQLKKELFETSKELLWATSDEVDRALHYEDEVEELRKEIFE